MSLCTFNIFNYTYAHLRSEATRLEPETQLVLMALVHTAASSELQARSLIIDHSATDSRENEMKAERAKQKRCGPASEGLQHWCSLSLQTLPTELTQELTALQVTEEAEKVTPQPSSLCQPKDFFFSVLTSCHPRVLSVLSLGWFSEDLGLQKHPSHV